MIFKIRFLILCAIIALVAAAPKNDGLENTDSFGDPNQTPGQNVISSANPEFEILENNLMTNSALENIGFCISQFPSEKIMESMAFVEVSFEREKAESLVDKLGSDYLVPEELKLQLFISLADKLLKDKEKEYAIIEIRILELLKNATSVKFDIFFLDRLIADSRRAKIYLGHKFFKNIKGCQNNTYDKNREQLIDFIELVDAKISEKEMKLAEEDLNCEACNTPEFYEIRNGILTAVVKNKLDSKSYQPLDTKFYHYHHALKSFSFTCRNCPNYLRIYDTAKRHFTLMELRDDYMNLALASK